MQLHMMSPQSNEVAEQITASTLAAGMSLRLLDTERDKNYGYSKHSPAPCEPQSVKNVVWLIHTDPRLWEGIPSSPLPSNPALAQHARPTVPSMGWWVTAWCVQEALLRWFESALLWRRAAMLSMAMGSLDWTPASPSHSHRGLLLLTHRMLPGFTATRQPQCQQRTHLTASLEPRHGGTSSPQPVLTWQCCSRAPPSHVLLPRTKRLD